MPTLNYILRPGKDNSASIQIFYNYGKNKRLRYSTGLKLLDINNWNEDKQRIKNVRAEIDKLSINNKLDDTQAFINKLYTELTVNQKITVTNDLLKTELNAFFNKNIRSKKQDIRFLELLPFFEWYYTNYTTNPLPTIKKPLSKTSVKTYKSGYTLLKKFNDEVYNLNYKKITFDFYDDYLSYLYSLNYSTNYIGTQVKILKTIMNASLEKDFHNNTDFNKRYFAKPTEQVTNIYLTEKELLKIYNLDLTNIKSIIIKFKNSILRLTPSIIQNARDLFLIGANTGLRISDFNKLTAKNIITVNGSKYLNLVTSKTETRLTIPINPMVNAILEKREGKPPKTIQDQHLNYAIKEIGRLAKINSDETKIITKGGKKVILNFKKYELISSHTARRSFCTNAYKSEMPTIDIMAISGHKSEKVFYNYIKVTDLERAEKIKKHKFFTKNNLKVV